MRRVALIAVIVCGLASVAAGDGDATWDGSYERAKRDGNEMCPVGSEPIVVSGGKFSIPWNLEVNHKRFHVGQITASVRPSGFVEGLEPKLIDPVSADALAELAPLGYTALGLRNIAGALKVKLTSKDDKRHLELRGGMCEMEWAAPLRREKVVKPAEVKAPPPLAAGAAKWDATFKNISGFRQDWRCPLDFANVVVKQGRFSLPWRVDARDHDGNDWGPMALGQIDGSIAANGKVKLRPWFSVSELPPEVAAGLDKKEATLEYVSGLVPTMTFTTSSGSRTSKLAFGKSCEYEFEDARTFKPGRSQAPSKSRRECRNDWDCASEKCEHGKCVVDDE